MTTTPLIVGPSEDARSELRAQFADEATHWHRRATEALLMGENERARVFSAVASVSEAVADGRLR